MQALEAATSAPPPTSASSPLTAGCRNDELHSLDVRLNAPAALAQQSGFELLEALHRELSMSSLDSSSDMDSTSGARTSQVLSVESEEAREDRLDAEDMKAAEREVDQYLREELANKNTNILEYWEVRLYLSYSASVRCDS